MNITQLVAQRANTNPKSTQSVINLLSEGATIPFIARYRKEATGSLDETQISAINAGLKYFQELDKRKETILKAIEDQDKLSPELKNRIVGTFDATVLEDIYLPYKRKRQTRAGKAKAKGLEPLANWLMQHQNSNQATNEANKFVGDQVPNTEAALQGAKDIIAEQINEDEEARNKVRFLFKKEAVVHAKVSRGKETEAMKYKDYFDYHEDLSQIPSHRLLAILRAENDGLLRVIIEPEQEQAVYRLEQQFIEGHGEAGHLIKEAITDAYQRLLSPSIENEFRKKAKAIADAEAIGVFADNLKQLLLAPPVGQKRTLGIDPGFRTGCKVVCLNENGDLINNTTIYPHPPQKQAYESLATIEHLIDQHDIEVVAIGNGTAGRETDILLKKANLTRKVDIFLINENGASIYSASEIAREEFPSHDITVRGAVSIGRRLMDPLAELVKIDPKSIGVGQYQHDVNQNTLKESLDETVESCVNAVGINLNTASKHLLTYVSGLGPKLAENIVAYRTETGGFKSRKELMKVPRMGAKAYEQAAGFLRVKQAKNPLDDTAVHPESYAIVEQMAKDAGAKVQDLIQNPFLRKQIQLQKYTSKTVGLPTLKDIMKELEKPGLDPRGEAEAFSFDKNIQTIGDLSEGIVLKGIITNITKFGAFVDIGIKENGLVHVSEMANRFIKDPAEVVKLNQKVDVKVISVDIERKRVQLSMKQA